MKSALTCRPLLGLFVSVATLAPIAAHAQAKDKMLVLDKPGAYVLDRDIMVSSGDAIMITASGVTLDLGGHSVTVATPGMGRGIVVDKAKGVRVANGKVGSFGVNVVATGAENVLIEGLQIVGAGLAPTANGPTEIGVMLINTRGSVIKENTLASVNLGLFIRGGGSTGNRLQANVITGGLTAANNLFGICYNPAPGEGDAGPRGDVIAGNHVARYGTAIALSAQSSGNILRDNTLAFFNAAYSATVPAGTPIVNDTTVKITP